MNGKGTLYIVSTPIGNLADITLRALDVLKGVDSIAAEDTRHSKFLLDYYQIEKPMFSLHEHNEVERIASLIARLQAGEKIALISDAGTPLISDPGYRLVRAAKQQGVDVLAIPGASALITALTVSGLPTDAFYFLGFLSTKNKQRKTQLENLKEHPSTLVCYEAPHRLLFLLRDICDVMGADRQVCLARELTKKFETVKTDKVEDLIAWIAQDANQQKGECVVLIAADKSSDTVKKGAIDHATQSLLLSLVEYMPPKKAAVLVAQFTGQSKQNCYNFLITRNER